MKRMLSLCAAALCLTLALTPTALAADFDLRHRMPRSATPPPSFAVTMVRN